MKKTRFYYFAPLDFDTVFRTQVIGWVNIFRDKGLDWTVVKINPVRRFSFSRVRADRRGIRELYEGRLAFLFTLPEKLPVTRLLNTLMMLALVAPALFSRKSVIIQIRSAAFHRSIAALKSLTGGRVRIIYDSRAAAAEEYLYNRKEEDQAALKVYRKLQENDRRMTEVADRVFCVSSALADYHMKQLQDTAGSGRFVSYPGNADSWYFFYSGSLRESMRSSLGLENSFLVVYSGGLEMPWHKPELLFEFFSRISILEENAVLLLLTNDTSIAERYAAEYGIRGDRIRIVSADNRKVHTYLNAADLATLFRDRDIMNRVASPTKFAEYILCGLPVAISPEVGDASSLIEETGWGLICDGPPEISPEEWRLRKAGWHSDREAIAAYGAAHLSKQAIVERVMQEYEAMQA